jgi:thioredoxin 2
MAPAVDALAAKRLGSLLVAKLDTDRAQAISQTLAIRGIPTTILFEAGKEVRRQSGAMREAELDRFVSGG